MTEPRRAATSIIQPSISRARRKTPVVRASTSSSPAVTYPKGGDAGLVVRTELVTYSTLASHSIRLPLSLLYYIGETGFGSVYLSFPAEGEQAA